MRRIGLLVLLLCAGAGCGDRAGSSASATGATRSDPDGSQGVAQDPGNQAADLELQQRIHQALAGNDQLSATARNVEIITRNGSVTLRGPVTTEDERNLMVKAAQQIAGLTNVVNHLELTHP